MKSGERSSDDRLRSLEMALEEALEERQEILEAAAKEIDHHKKIALETEQKLMDDFEWKLREIEGESRAKVRDAEAGVEARIKKAQDDYCSKKDSEFTRLSIAVRRDIEERKKTEIERVKSDLENRHKYDKENALTTYRAERDMELRVLQMSWDEEKNRLGREIRSLQRKLDDLPAEVERAVRAARSEHDAALHEERRKSNKAAEKNQEDLDRVREEAAGQINRLRADYDERIRELESRLENANTNRFSSMFQMKEEVETEFTERMEALRNMYKEEIDTVQEHANREKERATATEATLRETIESQQKEIDDLNLYYGKSEEEYDAKVNDLLTRLAEQTSLAQRLQEELDECEWYEEDEEEAAAAAAGGSGIKKVGSRPGSAKPPPDALQPAGQNTLSVPSSSSNYLDLNPPPRSRLPATLPGPAVAEASTTSSQQELESSSTAGTSNTYTYAIKPNPLRYFYL